jgi:DNA-directed RNA polymerase subunit M/transcription elongation factor TFIIS
MEAITKVKVLKMLTSHLSNRKNIKLFYDYLVNEDLNFVFECLGFLNETNGDNIDHQLKVLLSRIKDKKLGWRDISFDEMARIEEEEDEFLETPLEIAEGAIKCKCGSERVFSYTKQTKGGDESTSVFALCSSCKSKWVL